MQGRPEDRHVRPSDRHRFDPLSLGGHTAHRPQLDADPRITHNPLDLDFFKDKIVLLDFLATG